MWDWLGDCTLSERLRWQVLPWEWRSVPTWWTCRLGVYLRAKQRADQRERPMSEQQLAPYVPSRDDSEAYLRSIGAL